MHNRQHSFRWSVVVAVALSGAACRSPSGQGGHDGARPDASMDVRMADGRSTASLAEVAAIVSVTCGVTGCHDPVTKEHEMDLSMAQGIYDGWVGKTGLDHCGNRAKKRVVPGDPDGSFVIEKISLTMSCGASEPMPPPPRQMLSADQIDVIRAWIAAGARNDLAPADAGTDPTDDAAADGIDDDAAGPACTATVPCETGMNCSGFACGEPWTCLAHLDDTREHPCDPTTIPFCGCNGVTFGASPTCPDRPWSHVGACGDGVNCDSNYVHCSDPKPECGPGKTPSVVNDCYGPCVDVTACRCLFHYQCPDGATNTCLYPAYRCGPKPPVDAAVGGDTGA